MDDDDYDPRVTHCITDPEEIRRRARGDYPAMPPAPEGGWTPDNIGPTIRWLTEVSRPILIRMPTD